MRRCSEYSGFTLKDQRAWMNDSYKIYFSDGEKSFELYDLVKDPVEKQNPSNKMPDKIEKMKGELEAWLRSLQKSQKGDDYTN